MGSQHTLDVASGDAIVIVTRAATLRVDCHKMDGDWSLLLQYRADRQRPAACTEQSPRGANDRRSLAGPISEERVSTEPPPNESSPVPGRSQDDAESQSGEALAGVVADALDEGQAMDNQEPIEFGVIRKLGDLPPDAVISEDGLARLFGRHRVSIRRAVRRGELPPSVRLFGESTWTIEALRSHMNKRIETARRDAEQLQQRISRLRP
jgi:hypothetical protein